MDARWRKPQASAVRLSCLVRSAFVDFILRCSILEEEEPTRASREPFALFHPDVTVGLVVEVGGARQKLSFSLHGARTLSKRLLSILALSLALITSCEPPRESSLRTEQQPLLEQGDSAQEFQTSLERGLVAWRSRDSREKVEEAIAHFEDATRCSPAEKEPGAKARVMVDTLLKLSEAHYFIGHTHMEFDGRKESNRKDLRDRFEKGLTAAERALVLIDKDTAALLSGDEKEMRRGLTQIPDDAIPALYWYAVNLGEWSRHAGPRHMMRYRERVKLAVEVVQRRMPNHDHAGADRFLGIYHSRFPASGGDPRRSEAAFKESLELSPNYFDTRFRYALHYAVLVQERELFERQLRRILETPASVVPELEPENKLAQDHARDLLTKADQLFF